MSVESGTWGELACGLTIDADILEVVNRIQDRFLYSDYVKT